MTIAGWPPMKRWRGIAPAACRSFPPTWVTLHHLASFASRDATLSTAVQAPAYHFAPKVVTRGKDTCFLYSGDQAYEKLDIDTPGPPPSAVGAPGRVALRMHPGFRRALWARRKHEGLASRPIGWS